MWKHTDDKFLCVEPVESFACLLRENISRMGDAERVCVKQVCITDNVEDYCSIKVSGSTATMAQVPESKEFSVSSYTVDCLIKQNNFRYEDIDLLKIDTDGFDANCIFSASELLKRGRALIYWENCYISYTQYKKYK